MSGSGTPECQCKDHFTGDRCENRLDPKSIKVAYIAGGIGGAVALLIVIVIAVWMICFRFNKVEAAKKAAAASQSNEKLPPDALNDRMDDNFLYGRQAPAAITNGEEPV